MARYLRNIPIVELADLAISQVTVGSKYAAQAGPRGAITIHVGDDVYVLYNRQGEMLLGKVLVRDDKDKINKR